MNKKLVRASLAGLAAIALAAGGTTFAAWSDFGSIDGNHVGAGILKLNLNNDNGSGAVALDFGNIYPGNNAPRKVWVASSDGASVPNANLTVTLQDLVDQENGCSTNSEREADPNCDDAADTGELSQVVTVQTQYYPEIKTPENCGDYKYPGQGNYQSILPADFAGNLPAYIGQGYMLKDSVNNAKNLVLHPNEGVCIGIDVYWAPNKAASWNGPTDNAAQGDSMTFNVRFDLTQAF